MYKPSTAGFTLIELLSSLAVMVILAGLAVPAMAGLVRNHQVSSTVNLLVASLHATRLQAVSDGAPASLCPSSDGLTCRGDSDWSAGWIRFANPGRRTQPERPEDVRQYIAPSRNGPAVHATEGRRRIDYQPTGMAGGSNVTLRICQPESGRQRVAARVFVSLVGRVRSERPDAAETC